MGKGQKRSRVASYTAVVVIAVLLGSTVPGIAAWGAVGYKEDPVAGGGVNGPVLATTLIGNELWVGGEFSTARNYNGDNVGRQRLAVFDVNNGELTDIELSATKA